MSSPFAFKDKASKSYYYVAEKKNKRIFRELDAYSTTKELEQILLDDKAYEPAMLGPKYMFYNHPTDETEETTPLPPGLYKFGQENYPIPERLEVYQTRKEETYIQLKELDILKKDLSTFLGSHDLYKDLGFPYRRGYLLHGRPGNGKTAMIRSLLQDEMFKDAYIIWMNSIPSDTMSEALNAVPGLKVVIFEEIINQNQQVGFDLAELLAFLDGEASLKDCITIATTNYPQFLSENLANRPSRFDVVLEFGNPSDLAVYQVLEQLLKRKVDSSEFKNREFSFAQVKEIVLLHRMCGISLNEAAKVLEKQGKQFERGFEAPKDFGFGVGDD